MFFQVVATIVMLGFFGVLMEDPWKDWLNKELGLFELFFFLSIFGGTTMLAIAVIWS